VAGIGSMGSDVVSVVLASLETGDNLLWGSSRTD
jgi:hypothetical protein